MPASALSRDEFAAIWQEEGGSVVKIAERLNMAEAVIYKRRRRMEGDGVSLPPNMNCANPGGGRIGAWAYPRQIRTEVEDGLVVAFGDLHSVPLKDRYEGENPPGDTSAMLRLLEWLAVHGGDVRLLLCMGDVLDGGCLGSHPPLGHKRVATIDEEIGAAVFDLDRIAALAPNAQRLFTLGNHDERYERVLAKLAKEFGGIMGSRFQGHFERWPIAWSVRINDDIVALHKRHGGIHAAHNNVLKAGGAHVITGDTHRLSAVVKVGMMGPKYGVETGFLADAYAPNFEYLRGVDGDWQPGFAVLPFVGGELHRPYTVSVFDAPKPRVRVKAGAA